MYGSSQKPPNLTLVLAHLQSKTLPLKDEVFLENFFSAICATLSLNCFNQGCNKMISSAYLLFLRKETNMLQEETKA